MKLKIIILFLIQICCISITTSSQKTKLKITVENQTELTATLIDNSSTAALIELLKDSSLTISMHDYGNMEKVGPIGTSLPRNDEQIITEPGDLILYQGNALVIYYAPNSWNFTRLGKIDFITQDELKTILGDGEVTIILELTDTTTLALADTTINVVQIENSFLVYLNPVKDYVEIKGEFTAISILDSNGKKVLSSNKNIIDIRNFPTGIYFLKIKLLNNKIAYQKLLKV